MKQILATQQQLSTLKKQTALHVSYSTFVNVILHAVVDSGGVRGVQMHPPLVASNIFLHT